MTRINRKPPGPTAKARAAKARKRLKDYKLACAEVVKEYSEYTISGELVRCARCGVMGTLIQFHHKRPRSLAPELRTAKENIEPLCRKCHRAAHASGRRG